MPEKNNFNVETLNFRTFFTFLDTVAGHFADLQGGFGTSPGVP